MAIYSEHTVKAYGDDRRQARTEPGRSHRVKDKRDLKAAKQVRGTTLNPRRADAVIQFVRGLTIPSGVGQGGPFVLRPWQQDFIRDIYEPHGAEGKRLVRRAILSLGRKNGKLLSLDTPIPTPNGWSTMGELREGQQVFDERGAVCRVTYKSPVRLGQRCFRLGFADGTSIVAGEDHNWLTTHSYRPWAPSRRKLARHIGRPVTAVVTTLQIAESLHIERPDGVREHNHKLPVAGPLDCPEADLPISPYVLGYWLGNGDSGGASITVGAHDESAIVAELESELAFELSARKVSDRAPRYGLVRGSGYQSDSIQGKLRGLGVLNDKHIPESYLWASLPQRLALLQGLMDSDGTASGGNRKAPRCCFDVMNERLARGALQLVRSLGLKATIREDIAKINGRSIGPCWSVSFTAYQEDQVFRLSRRGAGLPPRRNARSRSNAIVACDEIASVPTQCIEVDSPSHLYLAGVGMTPTHNTALVAALVLAHLVGPEAIPNGEIYSAAVEREQAGQVYKFVSQMVRAEPELSALLRCVDSTKTVACYGNGSFYRALSSESGSKHGSNPSLVIYDELAQAKSRELYDVLDTSMGARAEPLMITISTQSNDPQHILSKLIDDGLNAKDPTIACRLFAADEDGDIFDPVQWKKANPALGDFLSLDNMQAEAAKAKRDPSEEPRFRNLRLNQRVSPQSSIIARPEWEACLGEAKFTEGEPVYLSLDLSSTNDLTALMMVSAENGSRVKPYFWKPEDTLRDHSNRDFGSGNHRYVEWRDAGHLLTTPGRSVDKAAVALKIAELVRSYRVLGLAYDRWRINDLLREFDAAGVQAFADGEKGDGLRLVPWGQGFKDMAPAIDALSEAVINRELQHPGNPVLTWNMANAIATMDPAGNRKIDKGKARFRIDGAVALAMTLGLKARDRTATEKPREYQVLFV